MSIINFPCYVGPWIRGTELWKEAINESTIANSLFDKVKGKHYWFDIHQPNKNKLPKDYETRLMNVRDFVNSINDREFHTDLPMDKVQDLGEFIRVQKQAFKDGHDGVLYSHAYGRDLEISTIKFKRSKDDD